MNVKEKGARKKKKKDMTVFKRYIPMITTAGACVKRMHQIVI